MNCFFVILDFDDTLFPTTTIQKIFFEKYKINNLFSVSYINADFLKRELINTIGSDSIEQYKLSIINLITMLKEKYKNIVIITSADIDWVYFCITDIIDISDIISKEDIISVNDYLHLYFGNTNLLTIQEKDKKRIVFQDIIKKKFNKTSNLDIINTVISIGDGIQENEAYNYFKQNSYILQSLNINYYLNIKLTFFPTINDLKKQLTFINDLLNDKTRFMPIYNRNFLKFFNFIFFNNINTNKFALNHYKYNKNLIKRLINLINIDKIIVFEINTNSDIDDDELVIEKEYYI